MMKKCLALLALVSAPLMAGEFEGLPQIEARGEASLSQPADTLSVSLGVATSAAVAAEAVAQNNAHMQQIVKNLKAAGLNESDYKTGRFHVDPVQGKEGKGIVRYDVVNAIQVRTQKIDLAEKIVKAAVEGGANQIDRLDFSLDNPAAYREAVIQKAATQAMEQAKVLAGALGVRVKRVLSASVEPDLPVMTGVFRGVASKTETPIVPGSTSVNAVVHLLVEIEQ